MSYTTTLPFFDMGVPPASGTSTATVILPCDGANGFGVQRASAGARIEWGT